MNTELKIARSAFKTDMKLVAEFTKQYKSAFKHMQRTGDRTQLRSVVGAWQKTNCCVQTFKHINLEYCHYHSNVESVLDEVRSMHVAYSLLRGRTIDQIEHNAKKCLNENMVKTYMVQYAGEEIAKTINLSHDKSFFTRVLNTIKEVCHG